jgi:hypothetical protein
MQQYKATSKEAWWSTPVAENGLNGQDDTKLCGFVLMTAGRCIDRQDELEVTMFVRWNFNDAYLPFHPSLAVIPPL